jgi:predicted enzyme related to lactoylglutathione lyase
MNKLVYWEIPSHDVQASAAFYAALFGWNMTPSTNEYVMFETGDGLAGGIEKARGPFGEGLRVYVRVDDIPAALSRAETLGATVVKTKTAIGNDWGHWAAIRDPGGCASVMLWSKD